MKESSRLLWMCTGLTLGFLGAALAFGPGASVQAASNDRFEDYVMCTGQVGVTARAPTEGLWLLDYRTGRLLSTVIDRYLGKIVGWAEVDLTTEFNIAPRKNVHFMMTTGVTAQGQAALYLVETTTGTMGVYYMGPSAQGTGFSIYRQVAPQSFRPPAAPAGQEGGEAPNKANIVPFAGKG
jgi:transposase InsO family protein